MNPNTIAIIPARGGSKRVPRKNIRSMNGRPLIAYTIEAALESGIFDRVLISTDCEEIADVASKSGAEVPFLRDPGLADDISPVSVATLDMLKRVDPDARSVAHVCQLMANCPLRDAEDIRSSWRQYETTSPDSQISVTRYGWQNPWWAFRQEEDFTLDPLFPEAMTARSQDLPELYCPTGAVWWGRAEVLRQEGTFHVEGRTGWEIDWRHGMDIDTEEDWQLTAALMNQKASAKLEE